MKNINTRNENMAALETAGLGGCQYLRAAFSGDFRGKILEVHRFGTAERNYCIIETDFAGGTFYIVKPFATMEGIVDLNVHTRCFETFEEALCHTISAIHGAAVYELSGGIYWNSKDLGGDHA